MKKLFAKLSGIIASRSLANNPVAAHKLRLFGSVAGVLDECGPETVRGWVYDAKRPTANLIVEILVDKTSVKKTIANVYRDDLARILNDSGLHGFECEVDELRKASERPRQVIVRLQDAQANIIGARIIEPNKNYTISAIEQLSTEMNGRLTHIFNHITATYENNLKRIDNLEYMMKNIANNGSLNNIISTNYLSNNRPSFDMSRSGISGIGKFRELNSEEMEISLFEMCIDSHLACRRHFA